MAHLTESVVESAALAWLEAIGWRIAHGPDIAPDMPAAERRDCGEVILAQRLRDALAQLRVLVKRILRKHGYPPDKQEMATQTVLDQAEVLSAEWAAV